MLDGMKTWIKGQPALYDSIKAAARYCLPLNDPAYDFFEEFSKASGGRVRFIQIGANDGLRNDPVREFIVRGGWRGVLVEPLPNVFELLKQNYRAQAGDGLHFVNAAVSGDGGSLSLWSFRKSFLDRLSVEERLFYLRKASSDRAHVERFLAAGTNPADALEQIDVPCVTVNSLVERYFDNGQLDLLVIDAEGHEDAILSSIDFTRTKPKGIFFESHNLAERKRQMSQMLASHGYKLRDIAGDTAAVL